MEVIGTADAVADSISVEVTVETLAEDVLVIDDVIVSRYTVFADQTSPQKIYFAVGPPAGDVCKIVIVWQEDRLVL